MFLIGQLVVPEFVSQQNKQIGFLNQWISLPDAFQSYFLKFGIAYQCQFLLPDVGSML